MFVKLFIPTLLVSSRWLIGSVSGSDLYLPTSTQGHVQDHPYATLERPDAAYPEESLDYHRKLLDTAHPLDEPDDLQDEAYPSMLQQKRDAFKEELGLINLSLNSAHINVRAVHDFCLNALNMVENAHENAPALVGEFNALLDPVILNVANIFTKHGQYAKAIELMLFEASKKVREPLVEGVSSLVNELKDAQNRNDRLKEELRRSEQFVIDAFHSDGNLVLTLIDQAKKSRQLEKFDDLLHFYIVLKNSGDRVIQGLANLLINSLQRLIEIDKTLLLPNNYVLRIHNLANSSGKRGIKHSMKKHPHHLGRSASAPGFTLDQGKDGDNQETGIYEELKELTYSQ